MKKIQVPILVAVPALVLAACGGSSDSESSAGGKDLVVAIPVPTTSGNSGAAEQIVNSAKLAVKQINADGGAGGRKLVLKVYDDKLTPDESAKVAQRAVTVDNAEIVVGGYTTIEGLAIRQVTEPRKVLYISPSTISPAFLDKAKYTYRVAHSQDEYPEMIVSALKELGYEKPVVIADDGPAGATLSQPLLDEAKAQGMTPKGIVTYEINATDLSGPVAKLKSAGADVVISIGSAAADQGLTVKTMVERAVDLPIMGFGSLVAPNALVIGEDAYSKLPAVVTLANQDPTKPAYEEFAAAYAKEFNGGKAVDLIEPAGQTWDAFTVIDKALDATDGDSDGDKMIKQLDGLTPFEGVAGKAGSTVGFKEGHSAYHLALVTFKFENGKPVPQVTE